MLKMYITLSLLVITFFQVVGGSELCSHNSKTLRYCDGSWYCCQSNTRCCSTTSFPYYALTKTGDLCWDTVNYLYYCKEGYSCCRGGTSCCKDSGIGSSGSTRHDLDIDSSRNNTSRDSDIGSGGYRTRGYVTRRNWGSGYSTRSRVGSEYNTRSRVGSGYSTSSRVGSGYSTSSSVGSGYSTSSRVGSEYSVRSRVGSRYSVRSSVGTGYSIRSRVRRLSSKGLKLAIYFAVGGCVTVLAAVISCICKCKKSTARTAGPGNDVIGRY